MMSESSSRVPADATAGEGRRGMTTTDEDAPSRQVATTTTTAAGPLCGPCEPAPKGAAAASRTSDARGDDGGENRQNRHGRHHLTRYSAVTMKKRSIDYFLEGQSVKTNPRLARFASAPYLRSLRDDPSCVKLLSRSSLSLRKEIIEAYATLEKIEDLVEARDPRGRRCRAPHRDESRSERSAPAVIVDLCSGKGFFSVIAACEFPDTPVLMVDNNVKINMDHLECRPNLHLWRADVLEAEFEQKLREEVDRLSRIRRGDGAGTSDEESSSFTSSIAIMVGMHLCGALSPRAIELFSRLPRLDALILAPCCLHKLHDAELKAVAKRDGVDPYQAKVQQLCGLLLEEREERGRGQDTSASLTASASVTGTVCVSYDDSFRTNKSSVEGGKDCKNAFIVGQRHRH